MTGRLVTILKWIILLPVFAVLLLLAAANTQGVSVHFNPFDSGDPVLTAELALYQVVFVAFVVGVLCGGLVVWTKQHKYRRRARLVSDEAARWQARAERSERRDAAAQPVTAAAFLPGPERG